MRNSFFIFIVSITPLFAQSSLVEEAGYIMAMETTFLAMSYLSTQDQYYGHFAVGGFAHLFLLQYCTSPPQHEENN